MDTKGSALALLTYLIYDELAVFVLALVLGLFLGQVLDGSTVGGLVDIFRILRVTDLDQIPLKANYFSYLFRFVSCCCIGVILS